MNKLITFRRQTLERTTGGRDNWPTTRNPKRTPKKTQKGLALRELRRASASVQSSRSQSSAAGPLTKALTALGGVGSVLGLLLADAEKRYVVAALLAAYVVLIGLDLPRGRKRIGLFWLAAIVFITPIAWSFIFQPKDDIKLADDKFYVQIGDDKCYSGHEEPKASLTLKGQTTRGDFVSCQYSDKSPTVRTYFFDLGEGEGKELIEFRGTFGVDEEDSDLGKLQYAGATATWVVSQGNQDLCSVKASWESPGTCKVRNSVTLEPGEPLMIEETLVLEERLAPGEFLWLGIAKPRLVVRG